jgi:class 3 adenylate cyclase/tetratricopeptide (TPR) repeat protein
MTVDGSTMKKTHLIGGRYHVSDLDTNLLGSGGMGQVYRATDLDTGEIVAVKVLNPEVVARAPDVLDRFVREGEALRQLNHPNIVRMIGAIEESGRHYLVMEYMPGGSLRELLDVHGRLSVKQVVDIGLDLSDAMTRAHRLGILHRDLKPANVLLAADGTPRLADFGLARLGGGAHLTQAGVLMGTVDYVSPEACQGEPLDERADIWSFGVMLLEMLTGRVPFGGDTLISRLTAILTQPLPDLSHLAPGLPEALADLLSRMLEKDRRQRIASVRQVGLELEALQKGRPVSTPPIPPAKRGVVESRFGTSTPARGYRLPGRERRLATVLLCGAEAPEDLDPEELSEVMDGAFEFCAAAVQRREGTVTRPMASTITAFFGAPQTYEDAPERAIRAALEIVAAAAQYAQRLEQDRGIRGFRVRVGINTGQVVVGEAKPNGRVEYTPMGDAVNLAALMKHSAPPGGILISHAAYRHVRGVFDVQAQPPLPVEGVSQPVQSYLVKGARPRAWRMDSRGVEGIKTRMVGREAELLRLQVAHREVVQGHEARVVTVVGEPGVGKSRLLDEFTAWLDLQPERVWYLRGRASAEGRSVAYSPWRDLFAYQFDIRETDSCLRALVKFRWGMSPYLEPEDADLVGHLVGFDFAASSHVVGLLNSPSLRQIAAANLVRYLHALMTAHPVMVLLEDLHWADDSSLDLLAQLVDRLAGEPLLVVGASRPELWERRPSWGEGQERYIRVEVKPLSKLFSRVLVEELLHKVRDTPEAVQQLVVEGAEGNPFYAEELIKMLIEDGVIVPGAEEWRVEVDRLAQMRVPSTLTAVLQARLDSLPAEERQVLQQASVVGREFWAGVVAELAGAVEQPEEVQFHLRALRSRELVYRRERSVFAGTEEYLFKHNALRDVTYETVLQKVRQRYHAQVAAWLEGHAGERLGEYLGLIAGHYELAGARSNAIPRLLQAGNRAAQQYANPEAIEHIRRALALLDETTAREFEVDARRDLAAQLYEGLGDVLARVGRQEEAQDAYRDALAQILPSDAIGQARVQRKIGNMWQSIGQFEAGLQAYDLAEAALGQQPPAPSAEWWQEWLEIQNQRMALYYWPGKWQEIAEIVDTTWQALAQHGTAFQRTTFYANVNRMCFRRDRYTWSEEIHNSAQAALSASLESADPLQIAAGRFEMGIVSLFGRELDTAERELSEALTLAERIGDAVRRVQCLTWLTVVNRYQGRVAETLEFVPRSLDAAAAAHLPMYVAAAQAHLAWVKLRNGDLAGAWEDGQAAVETWKGVPQAFPFQWMAYWPLIGVTLARHQVGDVIGYARALLEPTQQRLPDSLVENLEQAITAWEQGDCEATSAGLARACRQAQEMGYL